jgi:hypothetical protein
MRPSFFIVKNAISGAGWLDAPALFYIRPDRCKHRYRACGSRSIQKQQASLLFSRFSCEKRLQSSCKSQIIELRIIRIYRKEREDAS